MKPARIAILAIALAAAGGSAILARGLVSNNEPVAEGPAPRMNTVEVLVASKDVTLGQVVTAADIGWQDWPSSAARTGFIRRDANPGAMEEYKGAIARVGMLAGEPVNDAKLVRSDTAGFLSAILPKGSRAISIKISPETSAGGFILPNDRVDVILTRQEKSEGERGQGRFISETVLTNVRVLAIDQQVAEKDGEKVVVGKTATLELRPLQAEELALAESRGEIALALRSLRDAGEVSDAGSENRSRRRTGTVTVVRFGAASQVNPGQ